MNVTLIILGITVLILAIISISCISCSPRACTYPRVAIRHRPVGLSDESVYASYV